MLAKLALCPDLFSLESSLSPPTSALFFYIDVPEVLFSHNGFLFYQLKTKREYLKYVISSVGIHTPWRRMYNTSESLSFTYTANGNRQIQVGNFSK